MVVRSWGHWSVLCGVLVFIFSGCTRSVEEKSQLTFKVSSLSSKANTSSIKEEINFIAVNVTGPGMDRVVFNYDGDGNAPAPEVIELEVESGPDRLIQILVIANVEDSASALPEYEEFRYGEVLEDLSAGDQLISMQYSSVQQNHIDGNASGHYLLPDGSSYTGKVSLQYTPENGSPSMEVLNLEMFNGWFGVYLLDNIDLTYRLGNGHVMFEGPVNLGSSLLTSPAAVKKVTLPAHYSLDESGQVESRAQEVFSFGFWQGAGAQSSKTACHDASIYESNNGFLDMAMTNSLTWPSEFTLNGGTTCGGGVDPLVTSSEARFTGELIDQGGGVSHLMVGPYMKFEDGGGYHVFVEASHNGVNALDLQWRYLPGVIDQKMVGSTVFYRSFANFDGGLQWLESSDGLNCDALSQQGYQKLELAGSTASASVPVSPTDMATLDVLICPRRADGSHFRSAVGPYCLGGSCGGVGPGLNIATELSLQAPDSAYPHLNSNACTTFEVLALSSSGSLGHLPNFPYKVDLLSDGTGDYYIDPYCSTMVTGPFFMLGSLEYVWFKGTNTPGISPDLRVQADPTEPVVLAASPTLNTPYQAAAAPASVSILGPDNYYVEEPGCRILLFSILDAGGVPTVYSGSGTNTITVTAGGAEFYDIGDCGGTSVSSLSISGTQSVYVKEFSVAAAATGAATIDFDGSLMVPVLPSSSKAINIIDPTADHAVIDYISGSAAAGSCMEFEIITRHHSPDGPVRAKIGAAESYNLSTHNVAGQFFSSLLDCAAFTSPIVSIAQSASTSAAPKIYFKPSSPAALNFEIRATPTTDANLNAKSMPFSY